MPQPISCMLRGDLTSLPQYWEQRQAFGPLIHDDEVHGTFQLGLLASEVLKHPACEFLHAAGTFSIDTVHVLCCTACHQQHHKRAQAGGYRGKTCARLLSRMQSDALRA